MISYGVSVPINLFVLNLSRLSRVVTIPAYCDSSWRHINLGPPRNMRTFTFPLLVYDSTDGREAVGEGNTNEEPTVRFKITGMRTHI
jgi:hypothetical protein